MQSEQNRYIYNVNEIHLKLKMNVHSMFLLAFASSGNNHGLGYTQKHVCTPYLSQIYISH